MSASHRGFFSRLPQSPRVGLQNLSSSLKRIHRVDETPVEKSYDQLASKTSRLSWAALVEQQFSTSGGLRFSTSPLNLSAWNTTQLTPHAKYHKGASIYETSDRGGGERDRHKEHICPQRRHDRIMNRGGSPLLSVKSQEDSSDILGLRLLNRKLQHRSCQPAHAAPCCDKKQQASHAQPFDKPASSSAMDHFQRYSPPLQGWQVQKRALFEKFGPSGWSPRKRLAPDVLESIRALNSQSPEKYTTPVLAEQFKVSPEAIRRILKSKWKPDEKQQLKRQLRWVKRGETIWSQMVEIGIKPPKKWRAMGVKRND